MPSSAYGQSGDGRKRTSGGYAGGGDHDYSGCTVQWRFRICCKACRFFDSSLADHDSVVEYGAPVKAGNTQKSEINDRIPAFYVI